MSVVEEVKIEPQKLKWIKTVVDGSKIDEIWKKSNEEKAKKLQEVREKVQQMKNLISQMEDFKITQGGETTHVSKSKDRDPDKEFDTGSDLPKLMKMDVPPELVKRITEAHAQIVKLQKELEEMDFDDKEIANELWKPLVREGVVPDNTVPDRFNETVRVFNGASELYDEECLKLAEEMTTSKKVVKGIETTGYVLQKASVITDSVLGGMGGLAGDLGKSDLAQQAVDGRYVNACVSVILESGLDLTKSIIQGDWDFSKMEKATDGIGKIVEFVLKPIDLYNKKQNPDSPYLSKLVGGLWKSASSTGFGIRDMVKEPDPRKRVEIFLDRIGKAGEGVFKCLDVNRDTKGIWTEVGVGWRNLFAQSARASRVQKLMSKNPPDYAALTKELQSFASDALKDVAEVGTYVRGQELSGKKDEAKKSGDTDLANEFDREKLDMGARKEITKESKEGNTKQGKESLDDLVKSLQNEEKIKKAFKEMQEQETREELQKELEEFNSNIATTLGVGVDPEDQEAMKHAVDTKSIDMLIIQLQKDKAIFTAVEGLMRAAGGTAGVIFRPLAMAQYGQDFLKNIVKAGMRAKEAMDWVEMAKGAEKGSSVYAKAMRQRVKEIKRLLTDNVLNAIAEAGKLTGCAIYTAGLVGSASGFGGIAVGVGIVVEYGSKGVQAIKDLITDAVNERKLANQWKLYKMARENKYDRKQLRKSIAGNPTLAKYVIAYGAFFEDDDFAKEACRVAGLNEETLKHKSTNAQKVVKYLETKYSEDLQLKGRSYKKPFRKDRGKTEFTYTMWMKNYNSAQKQLGLIPGGTGAIEGGLSVVADCIDEVSSLTNEYQEAVESHKKAQKDYEDLVNKLAELQETFKEADEFWKELVELAKQEDSKVTESHVENAKKDRDKKHQLLEKATKPDKKAIEEAENSKKEKGTTCETQLKKLVTKLATLESAFGKYKPKEKQDKKEVFSADMKLYVDELKSIAATKQEDYQDVIDSLNLANNPEPLPEIEIEAEVEVDSPPKATKQEAPKQESPKDKEEVQEEAPKVPSGFSFKKQAGDSLCCYYALHHYSNGGLVSSPEEFVMNAAIKYKAFANVDEQEAKRIAEAGNDPGILESYGISKSSFGSKEVYIIADTGKGHFFVIRKVDSAWWKYDSLKAGPEYLGNDDGAKQAIKGDVWG